MKKKRLEKKKEMSVRDRDELVQLKLEVANLESLKHKLQVDAPRLMTSICQTILSAQTQAKEGLMVEVPLKEFDRLSSDLAKLYDRHCTRAQTEYKAKILGEVDKIDKQILRVKQDIAALEARISSVSDITAMSGAAQMVAYKKYSPYEKRMYGEILRLLKK